MSPWPYHQSRGIWRTRNFDLIAIGEMETSHIMNCLAMMNTKPHWRQDWRKPLEDELIRRKLEEVIYVETSIPKGKSPPAIEGTRAIPKPW